MPDRAVIVFAGPHNVERDAFEAIHLAQCGGPAFVLPVLAAMGQAQLPMEHASAACCGLLSQVVPGLRSLALRVHRGSPVPETFLESRWRVLVDAPGIYLVTANPVARFVPTANGMAPLSAEAVAAERAEAATTHITDPNAPESAESGVRLLEWCRDRLAAVESQRQLITSYRAPAIVPETVS